MLKLFFYFCWPLRLFLLITEALVSLIGFCLIFHFKKQMVSSTHVWIQITVSKKVEIEMDDYLNLWVLDNVEQMQKPWSKPQLERKIRH